MDDRTDEQVWDLVRAVVVHVRDAPEKIRRCLRVFRHANIVDAASDADTGGTQMAHHLILNHSSAGNFIVPDAADIDGLRDTLRLAMEDGEVVDIAVQIATSATTPPKNVTVTVNGAALSMFLIVSLP